MELRGIISRREEAGVDPQTEINYLVARVAQGIAHGEHARRQAQVHSCTTN